MPLSPNCGARRGAARPDLIVLHYTVLGHEAAMARLCDPAAEVSSHYLIAENGVVTRLVPEDLRAWHAGAGHWAGVADVNSRSIGIELVNNGRAPFAEPMMQALERLLPEIMQRWQIPPQRVIGHSDLAPRRKQDPGPHFDWRRLALQGLGLWPAPGAEAPVESLVPALCALGYDPDLEPDVLLAAFRLHFRPGASGPANVADSGAALDLAARISIDQAGASA